MNTNDPTSLLDLDALAAHLCVSPSTIRGWRNRGISSPPAIRMAGSVRWRLSDVNAWIDTQMENAGGEHA